MPVEFSKGEWGCGQEEINLRYAEPLEMADRHTLYKHGVKEIAHAQGSSITFMAKYDMGAAGSSFHLHSSLWDRTGKKSLFHEKGRRFGSALFGHWLAGQMAMAKELSYFYAPYVNSYKRYQAGSFAPTRIVAGVGQPHVRLPPLRRGLGPPGREPHPRRRRQPLPRVRRDHRRRAPRHPEEAPGAPRLRGQRLRGPEAPAGPQDAPRGHRRARGVAGRPRSVSATRSSSTTSTPRGSSSRRFDQVVTDWELMRGFERI